MPGKVRMLSWNGDAATATIRAKVNEALKQTALTVLGVSNGSIPVDTGSAQASGYVVGADIDGYAQAVSTASGLNDKLAVLPEVDTPPALHYYVSYAAAHEPILELGGHGQPARPHLTPAAEGQRGGFTTSIKDALGQL